MTRTEQGTKLLERNARYDLKLSNLEAYMTKIFNASSDEVFYIVREIYAEGVASGYRMRKNELKK